MAFPYNIAAIAAVIAAIVAALSNMSKFAGGGIVGGSSYTGDHQVVRVNSREMILNGHQQKRLFNMLNSNGPVSSGGQVEFKIKGQELVGILKNHNTKTSKLL